MSHNDYSLILVMYSFVFFLLLCAYSVQFAWWSLEGSKVSASTRVWRRLKFVANMAAPVDDMFSFCVDPDKVAGRVEVRFIDNVKVSLLTRFSLSFLWWNVSKKVGFIRRFSENKTSIHCCTCILSTVTVRYPFSLSIQYAPTIADNICKWCSQSWVFFHFWYSINTNIDWLKNWSTHLFVTGDYKYT